MFVNFHRIILYCAIYLNIFNIVYNNELLICISKYKSAISFFRRNTKKSIVDEYKLQPLKETIIWLEFSQTEWLLYNSYNADMNIGKFSVLLIESNTYKLYRKKITGFKSLIILTKGLHNIAVTIDNEFEKSIVYFRNGPYTFVAHQRFMLANDLANNRHNNGCPHCYSCYRIGLAHQKGSRTFFTQCVHCLLDHSQCQLDGGRIFRLTHSLL